MVGVVSPPRPIQRGRREISAWDCRDGGVYFASLPAGTGFSSIRNACVSWRVVYVELQGVLKCRPMSGRGC